MDVDVEVDTKRSPSEQSLIASIIILQALIKIVLWPAKSVSDSMAADTRQTVRGGTPRPSRMEVGVSLQTGLD